MSKKYIFSGINFKEKKPHFILDTRNENEEPTREFFPIMSKELTITRFKNKYCIGRYDLSTLESFACPNEKKVDQNPVCSDCFQYNGFNPAFYHVSNSEISEKQRIYNFQEHIVYLAYFSETIFKVGITNKHRQFDRWLEQGARVSTVIFHCKDAYEARDLEVKVSNLLQIPEVIRKKTKSDLINFKIDPIKLEKQVTEAKEKINAGLDVSCENSKVHFLDQYYNPLEKVITKDIIDLSENKPLMISGKIIGLFGSILVLENQGHQFKVLLGKLIGHRVIISDTVETIHFEPTQAKLF